MTATTAADHVLYRLFDEGDRLLYVGITLSPADRFAAHRADKTWWNDVATIRLQHLPDRESLEEAEREAIQVEDPRYNRQRRLSARQQDEALANLRELTAIRVETGRELDQLIAEERAEALALLTSERGGTVAIAEVMGRTREAIRQMHNAWKRKSHAAATSDGSST